MEHKSYLSHDAIDRFVATVLGWCDRLTHVATEPTVDVAFSDEWERKQIARELHWR
jgi:hypothetical protein